MQTVAFLDWGIGGLSVLKETLHAQPNLNALYFSDAGYTPYGKVPHQELRQRLETVFQFLISKGANILVVACNAASTAILDLDQYDGVQIINVITPTTNYCATLPTQKLGIIGGQRTVESHVYKLSIENQSNSKVFESAAQPLSALIEKGLIGEQDVRSDLDLIMQPLLDAKIESLVLACTHYPALAPVITKLYPHLTLIDPATHVVASIKDILKPQFEHQIAYYTTGSVEPMQKAARLAFAWNIEHIQGLEVKTLKSL